MRWPHTNSRIAVGARRLRSRFGIAAPRLTVRTHLPWYWKVGSAILILAASLALGGWVYDAGRSIAGYKYSAMDALKTRTSELEVELAQQRSAATMAETRLQIELAAQAQFKKHTAELERENAKLREDLAVFENMAQGRGAEAGIGISRLRVDAIDGAYQYSLLASRQQGKKDGEFRGNLQLLLSVQQADGNAMITLPAAEGGDAGRYQVSFRNFHRLEGRFNIPDGARLVSVEARLIQDGKVRASQRITL
jgi:hypothetical protein